MTTIPYHYVIGCEVSDVLAHNGGSLGLVKRDKEFFFQKKEALKMYQSAYSRSIAYNVSVPELVQRCGLKYKKTWNKLIILCPFHDEKTPSLHFSLTKCVFHCHGCGESGNMFWFVCNYLFGGDAQKTFKWFKKNFGIPFPWEK